MCLFLHFSVTLSALSGAAIQCPARETVDSALARCRVSLTHSRTGSSISVLNSYSLTQSLACSTHSTHPLLTPELGRFNQSQFETGGAEHL